MTLLFEDVPDAVCFIKYCELNPNEETLWQLLLQLVYLLKDLHKAPGFGVHGNLTPANILVTEQGVVKAGPFGGLLRGQDELSVFNDFIAPEEREGIRSPKTDVFALGRLFQTAVSTTRMKIST